MFKYQRFIQQITNCPQNNCLSENKTGYRFVFDNFSGNSFIPVAIQQPQRSFKKSQKCSSLGLSMFGNEQEARRRFTDLMIRNRNIYKQIGNNLASVIITPSLGLCSIEDSNSHFDFYEYNPTNLSQNSSLIGNL